MMSALSNNAMQLTRGGRRRLGASWSARVIVHQGKVVRPSQLIASVRRTPSGAEHRRGAQHKRGDHDQP